MLGDHLVQWHAVAEGTDGEIKRTKRPPAKSWWFQTTGQAPFGRAKAAYWKINRNDGAGLLEAIPERFEQLAHGRKGIVIKQRSHPLPQQAFATQLRPHRLEQGATQLLGLIHQKR